MRSKAAQERASRSNLKLKVRAVPPWEAAVRMAGGSGSDDDVMSWVKRHVRDKAPWHVWREPQPAWLPATYRVVAR